MIESCKGCKKNDKENGLCLEPKTCYGDPGNHFDPIEESTTELSKDNWPHKGAGMRCETCVCFVEKNDKLGRCRRHAPTLSGWPAMFHTDWCYDHKLNPEKL